MSPSMHVDVDQLPLFKIDVTEQQMPRMKMSMQKNVRRDLLKNKLMLVG